jgi:2-oxoglutarate dehydrogenase E1 component
MIRRQLKSDIRKPLVVFTPKSLLRHPRCVSSLKDLSKGRFQELIDDATASASKVEKVVLCTGKIYYDLLEEKENRKAENIALVRLEQLYPLPQKQIDAILKKYSKSKQLIWAQEEPENMGAWSYILRNLRQHNVQVVSRNESGSPATGSSKRHVVEQKKLMKAVFE